MFFLLVVLFDLSFEFEFEALSDLWADLGENFLNFVLRGELALFELILEIFSLPLEVLQPNPHQKHDNDNATCNFHQQINIHLFGHVAIRPNDPKHHKQKRRKQPLLFLSLADTLFGLVLLSCKRLPRGFSIVDHVEEIAEFFLVEKSPHQE